MAASSVATANSSQEDVGGEQSQASGKGRRPKSAQSANKSHKNKEADLEEVDDGPVISTEEMTQRLLVESQQQSKMQKIMSASNQTEEERRLVRQKARMMTEKIREKAQEIGDPSHAAYVSNAFELENLYKKVHYPREASLDADNLRDISSHFKRQTEMLGTSDLTKFDYADIITNIQKSPQLTVHRRDTGTTISWHKLGVSVGAGIKTTANITFLFGPLEVDLKVRQVTKRKRESQLDNVKEVSPEDVRITKKDRKQLQERRVEVIQKMIDSECPSKQKASNFFQMVINPESFSQTVENIFDVAFMAKSAMAAIEIDENKCPVLYKGQPLSRHHNQTRQMIMRLDMETVARLAATYGVNDAKIKTRKYRDEDEVVSASQPAERNV